MSTRTGASARPLRLGLAARATLLVGLLFLLFVAFSPHWSASALLFTVDDSYAADNPGLRQYTTIQKAINNATNGDTVIVNAGIYTEYVIVNKTLTISGNPRNGTWIAPGAGALAFDIQANNVSISSLTFNISYTAIYIKAPFTRLSVDSVTFESNYMGVEVQGANNVSVNNSYFGNQSYGIYSYQSFGTFAGNNTFLNNVRGAYFDMTNASVVRDGNHTDDDIAVYLNYARRSVVDQNHIGNSTSLAAIGVYQYQSSQTVISSNRIDNFTGDGYGFGIQIDNSYDSTVKANDLSNVTHPIAVTPYEDTNAAYFGHSILSTNLIDGKPVYYYVNATNVTVPSGAGWIGAYNVTGLSSPFQNISRAMNGIWLNRVTNGSFSGFNFSSPTPQHKGYALFVAYSTNVTFFQTNVTGETAALYLVNSVSVTLRDGAILAVPNVVYYSILIYSCDGCALINNSVNLEWYSFIQTQNSAFLRIIGNRLSRASGGYHYYDDQPLFQDNVGNETSSFIYCYGCRWGRANNNTLTNSSYPVYIDGYNQTHFEWQIAANNTWEGRVFRSFLNTTNLTIPGNLSWMLVANVTNASMSYYDPNNGTYSVALIAYSTNISLRTVVANSSSYGISLREVQGVSISNYTLAYSSFGVYSYYARDVNITNATWSGINYQGVFSYYNTRLTVRNVTMQGSYAYWFIEDYYGDGVTLDNVTITRTSGLARVHYGTGYTFNRANQSVQEVGYYYPYIGVYAYNVTGLNVTNSSFRDGEIGVFLNASSWNILLRNITIANMTGHGVYSIDNASGNMTIDGGTITGRPGYASTQNAIHFENLMAPIAVRNLNISLFWVAVFVDPANNVTVQGNNISSTNDGIWFTAVSDSIIRSNTINSTTFTGIRIDTSSSNITVDSNTLRNAGSFSMLLSTSTRLSVTNNSIQGSTYGIYLEGGRDDSISFNTVNGTSDSGIRVGSGHQNSTFTSNTITNSAQFGFFINQVSFLTLVSNAMSGSTYNFRIEASIITRFYHTIPTTNTVNSKPIYFLVNQTGGSVPTTAGVAILANCSGTLVNALTVDHNWHGVLLFASSGITVLSVTAGTTRFGVEMRSTVNSTIQDTTINDAEIGIQIVSSNNNTLTNNVVNSSSIYGIFLSSSNVFTLTSNRITNSSFLGLYITSCSGGTFTSNQMSNDGYSFYIFGSSIAHYNHSMPASNTINGVPIFYRLNTTSVVVPASVSAVVLANVTNATIADLFLNRTYTTVDLFGSFNVSVTNLTIDIGGWGVRIRQSNNITLTGLFSRPNSYISNYMVQVETGSHNITVSDVNLYYGNGGLAVAGPNTANISLTNATFGNRTQFRYVYISVYVAVGVDNVTLSQVNFNYSYYHVYISSGGAGLRISNFTVANSSFSRFASSTLAYVASTVAENVTFYHNNIETAVQAPYDPTSVIRWYRDYPYGGNFWDNWTAPDVRGGASQSVAGADGIVDNPFYWTFVYDAYPLVDPWPPQVVLNLPNNNSVVAAGAILDFNVSRYYDAVTYAINNGSASAFAAPFDLNTSGWADGTYHLWVNATDATGENPSRWFVVAIDSTAPSIAVVSPPSGSIYNPGTQLNFSIVDAHLALNATWNNGSGNVSFSTIWNISTTGWADGDYNITIVAWDTAGNRAQQTFLYGIDGVAPAVALVTPSNNSVIRAGTILDLSIVDVHFANASWNSGSGPNPFTAPFDINTSGWADGAVTVTVFANDTTGRQTMRQYNFIMDSTAPAVTLNTPGNNSVVRAGTTLDLAVSDANLNTVTWNNGSGPNALSSPYDISTGSWPDGVVALTVVATDAAGNVRTSIFNFDFDSTAPSISLGTPVNGSVVTVGTTLDLSITDVHTLNATWNNGSGSNPLSSPFDIVTTGWPEGLTTVTINATDVAGNTRFFLLRVTLDSTAPAIVLNTPLNNSVIRAGTILDLSVTDPNLNTVTRNNGSGAVALTAPFDINTAGWVDGSFAVTVIATDLAGNTRTSIFNFDLDSAPPSISAVSPSNGSVVVAGTNLDFAITDAHSFNASWNNGGSSSALSAPYDVSTAAWADGSYNVTVNATDVAGNTRFFLLRVIIDSTAPTVSLLTPFNNSYIVAGTTLDFGVTDNNLNTVVWSNGGVYSALVSPYDISTASWADGVYTVRVNATDLAGNFRNLSFVFTVDSTLPSVTLVSPANNSYLVAGATLDFSVSDTNLNTTNWSNGGAYSALASPFDITTAGWVDGVYTVRINATDLAGNFRNISFVFTIDSTGPTVSLLTPLNNSYIVAGATLDFGVSDTNLNTVVWSNGGSYSALSSPYDLSTTTWVDGVYTVRINATDLAGNFRNVSFGFTVDSTAPSLTLVSPANNSYFVAGTTLDFSVSDTNLQSVVYSNGGVYSGIGSPYDVSTAGWTDGIYTVRVNASDLAGNFRNLSFAFTVDSTVPTVTLGTPLNNSYFAAGTTLDFSVSDTNLNTVVWSNGGAYSALASPYDVSTAGWADGIYTVRVNATDLAGNYRNSSFVFTVDSTAPAVTLASPLNNSYIVAGTTLDFSVSDTNLNTVVYSNGGAYVGIGSPYDVSTASWADGIYTVRVNASDLAGNFRNLSFVFTVDSTLPAIALGSPLNNSYFAAGTTLNFSVSDTNLNTVVWSNGGAYATLAAPHDISTSGWVDGAYTVRVNATDLAGNFRNLSFSFTVDSTTPVVVYNGPFGSVFWNGAIVLTAGTTLDFGVSDTNLNATNWTNGTGFPALSSPFDVATTGWADGLYTVRVNATDLAGNTGTRSVLILIDSTAPSWTFASPGNNSFVVAGSLLTFNLTELHPTVANWSNGGAPVGFTAQWNNTTGIVSGTLHAVNTTGWADAVYTLTLSARDAAGNTVVSVFTVTVDSTAPAISLVSPANNSVVATGVVIVIGVTELNLASATWNNGSGNTNFTTPFNISTAVWADGTYNVTVRVTDRSGTLTVRVYRLVVDSLFPVIPVPAWNATFVDAGTLLNISVIEGNPLWLNATLGAGSLSTNASTLQLSTAALADGFYVVNVSATDLAGHVTNASFVVTIDSVFPIIQGVALANNSFIKPGVPVSFAVVETNLLNVTWRRNGEAQLPANGTGPYSINTSGWGNVNNTVVLYARDLAGHVTTLTLVLVTDSLPPTLPNFPANQSYDEDVPVTFDASSAGDGPNPLSNSSLEWNFSGRLSSLATGFVVVSTWDTPGNYTLVLTITDAAGNSNFALYGIRVRDTTPPVARAGADATEDEDIVVTLDGTSSTDNDPDFMANPRFLWTQVGGPTVAFNPVASNSSFTPSQPGIYLFDLTVTDGAGLTNTDRVQFTILDITPPVLPAISYPVFNEGATVVFNATGTTDNDAANASAITYLWTFVDGALVEIDGINGSHRFASTGLFTVNLTATDVSGNRATRLIALRVNDIPSLATLPPSDFELPGIYEVALDILDGDTGDSHNITVVSPSNMTIATIGTKPALRFSAGAFGIYPVNFSLSDGWSSVTFAFNLTVTTSPTGNSVPVFSTEPVLEATSTRQYSYLSQATDPDGDRLVYGIDLFPAGMTINPATGAVNWPHGYTVASGDHFDNVSLWVWDGANFVYQNYTIRFLSGGNAVPTIGDGVIGIVNVKNGTTFDIGFGAFVADSNDPISTLTFNVTVLDPAIASATIQGTGATAKIVVRGLQVGTTTITLRVRDPSGAVATKPIQVTVEPVVTAPPPSSDPFGGLLLPIILAAAIAGAGMFFFVVRRRKDDDRPVPQPKTPAAGVEVAAEVIAAPTKVVRAPASAVALSAASAAAAFAAAAAVPEKKITYTIEGLFVIYKDGRLLYAKTDMGGTKFEDPELVSSMFTAVQSFIQDSFQAEGELNKMGYGDNHVIIERGNHIFVAAIVYGDPDAEFTETLRGAIEGIELSYAGIIEGWDGMMDHFSDMDQKLAPVAALTAGITRREVQLATTKQEVLMLSELEFFQGFVRLKVGIKNNTPSVITKATVDIEYNEDVLRLGRVEPAAYRTSGAKVLLGVLNPGEKSSVAYYFDPQICTESQIDGVCRYRDATGVLHSVAMKTRKAEVVCPLFFTKEHANTAMLKRLVEGELKEKDAKVFEIQKMPPYIKYKDVFDLVKSVVNAHDVQQVREFTKYNPFQGEAWFYGETKVKGYKMVIRTSVIEETNAIEFFAASINMKAITGLLAEFNHTLSSMIIEKYSDLKIALTFDAEKKAEIDKKSLMSNMSSAELEGGETEQSGPGSGAPPDAGA